jgi:hypothetical protein
MEEEVDPILAKLNAKNKPSPSPVVEEEDPILKKLNASKKKEPTTVKESSGVGGKAQPATAASKPFLEESKPVEKSTDEEKKYNVPITGKSPYDPFGVGEVIVKQLYTGITDQIPKSFAQATEVGISAIQPSNIDEYIKRSKSDDFQRYVRSKDKDFTGDGNIIDKVKGVFTPFDIDKYLPKYKDQFVAETGLTDIKQKIDERNPKIIQRRLDLEKYVQQQNQESSDKLGGVPQSYKEVGSVPQAVQYAANLGAQGLWQIPLVIATSGMSGVAMEAAEVYDNQLENIAEEKGITREEVIKQNLDKPAEGQFYAVAAAGLDRLSAGKLLDLVKKSGAPLTKTLMAVTTETLTEPTQGTLEEMGGASGAGQSVTDAFEKAWTTNLSKRIDEAAGGFFGSAGPTILSQSKSPKQVVSESQSSVQSTDDTQGALDSADKIVAATETYKPGDTVELSTKVTNKDENVADLTLDKQKSENKVVEEGLNEQEQGIGQGADMEFTSTVGENYVKRNNRWVVKDADGAERPLISDNPNKTVEEQNTELSQLKELKTQLETQSPVKLDLSPTGKGKIAQMEASTPEGRARKWLFSGGKLLWNSRAPSEGKSKLRGIKDETGFSLRDKSGYEQYLSDKNGKSVEAAAESIASFYGDEDVQKYRNALIEVFSTNPKTWHEQQIRDEDADYAYQQQQQQEEANLIDQQILNLEAEESGIRETNQQLYENERRVNYGVSQSQNQGAGGEVGGTREGDQAQVNPRESIRKNGNADKSKQAVAELATRNLTHVPGLGMGQNQAKGTYISTEDQNRYETEDKKPVKVKVNVQNPFVSEDDTFYNIQREIIQSRFGKNQIEDLTETEADLLAEMVTEHFMTEGFDSIYMPQSETQEGELIVFDRGKVTIMDDARIEYENAVYESAQTTLRLEFIPDTEFLKTDKPIELREKQKKIRKDLARLNQLIKCR